MREDRAQLELRLFDRKWWLYPEKPAWDYTRCKTIPKFPFLPHDAAVCTICGSIVHGWDHICRKCDEWLAKERPISHENACEIWQKELTRVVAYDLCYGGYGTWHLHKKQRDD